MLRLNFVNLRGESPTLLIAPCVRFSADGTLRGPDNYVIAKCIEGSWQVGGRLHRELNCEGPLCVRLMLGQPWEPRLLGPFREVHTRGGMLYGDDACLNISLPGRIAEADGGQRSFSVTFERGSIAKA
jgi:hypothetical protein